MAKEFNVAEAADYALAPAMTYRDLKPGDRFRFPGWDTIQVKTARGYRDEAEERSGPAWTTGAGTAVIPVEPLEPGPADALLAMLDVMVKRPASPEQARLAYDVRGYVLRKLNGGRMVR